MDDRFTVAWTAFDGLARELSDFVTAAIGGGTEYISHGEIQTGLSRDPYRWSDSLSALYEEDFAHPEAHQSLPVARDAAGGLRGVAIVAWESSPRRRFAVLEDLIVDPASRGAGIGAAMLAAVRARVRDEGVDWLFLESGVRNTRAHAFFERHGFAMTGHVFAASVA